MSWGSQYQDEVNRYNALSLQDRAQLSGFNYGGTDESGQPIWSRADGNGLGANTDAGETGDQYVRNNTRFDSQAFFNQLGVVPVDMSLTNNGPTPGYKFESPQAAQDWADMTARSYSGHGYNFNNFDDLLKKMTGPGQYVNDPTLGKVWVPNNRDSQTWNTNFVNQGRGGGLFGTLNKLADNGAIVKGIGMQILAPAISDVFGNVMNTVNPAEPIGSATLPTPQDIPTVPTDEFGNAIDMTGATPATPTDVINQTASAKPTIGDSLSQFVKDTFSVDNLVKQGIKQGVSGILGAAMPSPAGGSSTTGGTLSAGGGTATGGDTTTGSVGIIGAGIDPAGAKLAHLDGSNVFTDDGTLAIPGRGIINSAINP